MCGDMKGPLAFYFHPDSRRHRIQCKQCDYLWKQIHKQIRRQGCTGLYYEHVKQDGILRTSLFELFCTYRGPLSDVCIKTWAQREQLVHDDVGAANRLPASGGPEQVSVQAGSAPAPGGVSGMPPGPAGPGGDGSGNVSKRLRLSSVTQVRFDAEGLVFFESRTDVF